MTSTLLRALPGPAILTVAVLAGCTHTIKVEPIKVEPIDITLHIYLEADQKLDAFFGDAEKPAKAPAGSTPAGGGQPEGVH